MARRPRKASEPTSPPILDFCVHGQAVSAQTARPERKAAWQRRIRTAAADVWRLDGPLDELVRVQVTFFQESELGDLDNLAKPVLDALQGVVYQNDRQIGEVVARRRDIESSFKVRYMSLALAKAFSDGRQFVHIQVWQNPGQEVVG